MHLRCCAGFILGCCFMATAAAPKNVILMISDGCGYNTLAAANFFQTGKARAQPYERFPVAMPMSTWSATGMRYDAGAAKQDATWVTLKPTDSAASGTALATGTKTYDAAIGMDTAHAPLLNLTQRAQLSGKSAGVVTTVPISHATPAAFVAHNGTRKDYAGIAQDMLRNSSVEVIIGAGHPFYDHDGNRVDSADFQYVGGRELWETLVAGEAANKEGKWSFVERKGTFDSLAAGLLPLPERLVGVAQVRETLQEKRGNGGAPATDTVGQVPFVNTVPNLSTLSQVALRALSRDSAGFFLMIEGGAVDWAAHGNSLARAIEEEMDFNAAVQTVMAWIEKHGGWKENLLVVTTDHETGYLTGPGGVVADSTRNAVDYPLQGNGKGKLPLYKWNSSNHTNQLVPLFAKGAGSDKIKVAVAGKDPLRGKYTDNALLGQILLRLVSEGGQ